MAAANVVATGPFQLATLRLVRHEQRPEFYQSTAGRYITFSRYVAERRASLLLALFRRIEIAI
jgi:hypothetical protein